MSYISVPDADVLLAHNPTWVASSTVEKKNHLATASLWLNFSYEWPGVIGECIELDEEGAPGYPYSYPFAYSGAQLTKAVKPAWPRINAADGGPAHDANGCDLTGIPYEVKSAQAIATEVSLTTSLFINPTANTEGLVKKRVKAGPVEIEREWSSPVRGKTGEIIITEVDAVLHNIASRKGQKTGRLAPFF